MKAAEQNASALALYIGKSGLLRCEYFSVEIIVADAKRSYGRTLSVGTPSRRHRRAVGGRKPHQMERARWRGTTEMSLVYIFAASPVEGGEPVRKIAGEGDSRSPLRCGSNDVVLIFSGMGPGNARSKAELALGLRTEPCVPAKPDAVLVVGLCGGLTESLSEGRVVAYTACRSTEVMKPVLTCSENAVDFVVTLLTSSGIPCDRAMGITSPRIATNRQELALAESGAAVVDMESYSILEAATGAGGSGSSSSCRVRLTRSCVAKFESRTGRYWWPR